MSGSEPPTLCFIYGPPAVGKFTVAREVTNRVGYRLLHNHLTSDVVSSILDRSAPSFLETLCRLRVMLVEAAADVGASVVITTAFAAGHAAFIERPARAFETRGGRVRYVRLVAPTDVLVARVADESRRTSGKLVDAESLLRLLEDHDMSIAIPGTEGPTIDTSICTPAEAADTIVEHLKVRAA